MNLKCYKSVNVERHTLDKVEDLSRHQEMTITFPPNGHHTLDCLQIPNLQTIGSA